MCAAKSLQLWTLCDPVDCSHTVFSVHRLLQGRILGEGGGLPCPPPGHLRDPGIKSGSLTFPALAARFFITSTELLMKVISRRKSGACTPFCNGKNHCQYSAADDLVCLTKVSVQHIRKSKTANKRRMWERKDKEGNPSPPFQHFEFSHLPCQ